MTFTQATLTENGRPHGKAAAPQMDDQLRDVLAGFPAVVLAVLFGSIALWGVNAQTVTATLR